MRKLLWAISAVGLALSCCTSPTKPGKANSQSPASIVGKQPSPDDDGIVPPEVVRSENVHIENGFKTVTVSNASGHYVLSCNIKAAGCITPTPGENYLLFNKNTRWKMPGARDFITLAFVQDWTVTYNEAENIGLVPENGGGGSGLGVYMLNSWTSNR
jgi:hypothetical protein